MQNSFYFIGGTAAAEALEKNYGPVKGCIIKPEEGGKVYTEGELSLVFKGCIYSYADPCLPCDSEEEYIIAAYRAHGESMFNAFEGKFSLYLFDSGKNCAYFARDHFGGMPLYWAAGEGFAIASDKPSSLANCGLVEKKLSRDALCHYFSLRFIPAPDTVFENIWALLPGHYIKAQLTGERVDVSDLCYWDVSCASEDMIQDYDKCKELLREVLLSSTEYCCTAERNGVHLSGGIDSTIITGVMSTLLGHETDSFTIGFNEEAFDESDRAAIAAKAHNTEHHLYILNYDESLAELDKIISGFDQPFADGSAIPTWVINRYAAQQGVTNVLTGDGSDQIFAGSNKYFIRHYVDKVMKFPKPLRSLGKSAVFAMPENSAAVRKLRKVMACVDMSDYEMRRRMLQLCLDDAGLARLLKGDVADKDADSIARLYALNRDITDELTNTLYVDLKVVADGGMMTKMGSMSRLAGVQTHMPIMSKSMLELAFRIPPEFKQRGSGGKLILKDAFSDIIPQELMTASKKGFEPPISTWFRGPLLGDLKAVLAKERLEAAGIFDADYVNQLIEEHCSMKYNRDTALWALYVFSKWYEKEFGI